MKKLASKKVSDILLHGDASKKLVLPSTEHYIYTALLSIFDCMNELIQLGVQG